MTNLYEDAELNRLMFPGVGPKWEIDDVVPDLTGKVTIVTGANSPFGIGFNVAQQLALKGSKVYVGARSTQKALDAIDEMKRRSPMLKDGQLQPFVTDLSNLQEVYGAAHEFLSRENRLDLIVHNAAILAKPLIKDKNGVSVSFVSNHLGPFLLTRELLPLLKETSQVHPGVRVVTVSSVSHCLPPLDVQFGSVEDFNQELGGTNDTHSNMARYGLSKLANILFAKELQKTFDSEGIAGIALSTHPGNVGTAGSNNFLEENPSFTEAAKIDRSTPLEGALTLLFAAASPVVWAEKDKYKGTYLIPYGRISETRATAQDPELAHQLWVTSDKVVNDILS